MKITMKKLGYVQPVMNKLIDQFPKTKLEYALKKNAIFLSRQVIEKFNDKVEQLRIELCSVDKDKNIISTEKQPYVFTPEKALEFTKKLEELKNEEYEYTPYLINKDFLPPTESTDDKVKTIDPLDLEEIEFLLQN